MLNLYHWFRRPQVQGAIYSTKEFRAIIDSECERADRYGQRLSLGVFEVGSPDENSVAVRRLVRTLHR